MPLLFSYGTLQQESVQLETLGRVLKGTDDALVGFEMSTVTVQNAVFVAATGKAVHANVVFSGGRDSSVRGRVFEISDQELALCDEYERPAQYVRVLARLSSGNEAWVYTCVASR